MEWSLFRFLTIKDFIKLKILIKQIWHNMFKLFSVCLLQLIHYNCRKIKTKRHLVKTWEWVNVNQMNRERKLVCKIKILWLKSRIFHKTKKRWVIYSENFIINRHISSENLTAEQKTIRKQKTIWIIKHTLI